jgi:hypothetical protein
MDPRLCIYEHFEFIFKKITYIHLKKLWCMQYAIK